MIKKLGRISIISLTTLLLVGIGKANAEEFIVSGNGENSQNNVAISTSSNTSVQQENNAEVKNDVATSANTGDNSIEGSTGGDSSIATGDANTQTTVANSANFSAVENDCCPAPSDSEVKIAGNGENSANNVSVSSGGTTTISIDQNAHVQNILTTDANTGSNNISGNNGDASIFTGDIETSTKVKNENINLAKVKASQAAFVNGNFVLTIIGNGEKSDNTIFADWFNDLFINIENNAAVKNIIETNANTGNNTIDSNNGDVTIKTGDVKINVDISNDVNKSIVSVVCCEVPQVPPPPPPPPGNNPPPPPPTSPPGGCTSNCGGGDGKGGDGKGGGPGDVLASILPVTGFNWFFATIANILMFLFGLYLRRRSGRSPSFAYAAV